MANCLIFHYFISDLLCKGHIIFGQVLESIIIVKPATQKQQRNYNITFNTYYLRSPRKSSRVVMSADHNTLTSLRRRHSPASKPRVRNISAMFSFILVSKRVTLIHNAVTKESCAQLLMVDTCIQHTMLLFYASA